MDLSKSLGGLTKGTSGILAGMGDAALDKVNDLIDEFKGAMATLATFGFAVEKLDVTMAMPPTIKTGIHGSISAMRDDEIKTLLAKPEENALLTKLLNGLLTLKRLSEGINLKNDTVSVEVTLGMLPAIDFQMGGREILQRGPQ